MLKREIRYLIPVLIGLIVSGGCKKEKSEPTQTAYLLEKINLAGQPYMEMDYNEQGKIRQIIYYRSDGQISSAQTIELNAEGKVAEINSDHGHYTSHTVATYEQGIRTALETVQKAKDGSVTGVYRKEYEYPAEDKVVVTMFAAGAPSYIITYTTTPNGNVAKIEREDLHVPTNNLTQTFTHGEGISAEGLIERNIPGYYETPIHFNYPLNSLIERVTGETLEENYQYEFDANGNLIKQVINYSNGGFEEFTYSYRDVKVPIQ